jgi:hypothetical protein
MSYCRHSSHTQIGVRQARPQHVLVLVQRDTIQFLVIWQHFETENKVLKKHRKYKKPQVYKIWYCLIKISIASKMIELNDKAAS